MKEVFVWRSFGDVEVFSGDYADLYTDIRTVLEDEAVDVNKAKTWTDILNLIDIEIDSGSDCFQSGTGFYTVKEG